MVTSQPVTGASTQQLDTLPSALCAEGLTPLNITGAILAVYRRHFSVAKYIRDPELVHLRWAPEPLNTTVIAGENNVLIEPVNRIYGRTEQFMQMRPAILVKRNRWVPMKVGLGDREQGHQFQVEPGRTQADYEIDTAIRMHVIIVGSHTVFCVGGTPGEAESVATEVLFETIEFAQLIRKDLDLNQLKVNDMGPVARLEESHEHFAVPIVLSYAYWHSWKLRPDHPVYLRNGT